MARIGLIAVAVLALAGNVFGQAWWNEHYAYRRAVDVDWDFSTAGPDSMAETEFYCAGHVDPKLLDVRVTTEDGKWVPSTVLMTGPGDLVRVAFGLTGQARRYFVYFGNPAPLAKTPEEELKPHMGVLLETREISGGRPDSCEDLVDAWKQAGNLVGREMLKGIFIGDSPFGEQTHTISKYSGYFSCPADGDYLFAISVGSRGGLFIDAKPAVFCPHSTGNIKWNKTLSMTRGRHSIEVYQWYGEGDGRVSVAWQMPGMKKVEEIGREAFGMVAHGVPGPMEKLGKPIVDYSVEYQGEAFEDGNYSQRYKFKATVPPLGHESPDAQWDFGDGLTARGLSVEHVFLMEGRYSVRVTAGSMTQVNKMAVHRDFEHIADPPVDVPIVQSRIVARYDVNSMPVQWLPYAVLLHLRAEDEDSALSAAQALGAADRHPNLERAVAALRELTQRTMESPRVEKMEAIWESAPADSDLQPQAARHAAELLVWTMGDFDRAVKFMEPLAAAHKNDVGLQRALGAALVLDQRTSEGRQILESLPTGDEPRKQAAISGAMARTIEYDIDQNDWESGEGTWNEWQTKYPAEFMEGYGVVLRTRLLMLRHANKGAAAVAEAFARAVPESAYSPQLLDRASKLLAKSDPKKSADLRALLKQRYPEDPLSQ